MAKRPPTSTAAPQVSGTPEVGQTLTCTQGSWNNARGASYAYAWQRDGSPIANATRSTYQLTDADAGHTLSASVTATNDKGSTTAAAKPTVSVAGGGTPPD